MIHLICPSDKAATRRIERIVVAEDEVLVRLDVEHQLTEAGFIVVGSAETADEVVRVVEREQPDLIIMDIRLAGPRDGVDAALEIWQRFGIRCLFASGNIDPESRLRACPARPWGFISKPFTLAQLRAAIERSN